MSFFAILMALLFEQVRPLATSNPIHAGLRRWVRWVGRNFDTGNSHHGWLAWGIAVGVPAFSVLLIYALLVQFLGLAAAVLWNVAVLYVTLGFRQFSHHFTGIRDALDAGDEDSARELLAKWQRVRVDDLPRSEIVRHVIEYSTLAAHRHVFGVLAWFSILAVLGLGAAGAVFYRTSEFVARQWRATPNVPHHPASPALCKAAATAWTLIDWLPARITALGFAVVGSFEDAIDSWRKQAHRFPNDNDGVILAATAGAINVRLGGEALRPAFVPSGVDGAAPAPALAPPADDGRPGRTPEPAHLVQVVGLVWRTVVMWMLLLALLTLARLLG